MEPNITIDYFIVCIVLIIFLILNIFQEVRTENDFLF